MFSCFLCLCFFSTFPCRLSFLIFFFCFSLFVSLQSEQPIEVLVYPVKLRETPGVDVPAVMRFKMKPSAPFSKMFKHFKNALKRPPETVWLRFGVRELCLPIVVAPSAFVVLDPSFGLCFSTLFLVTYALAVSLVDKTAENGPSCRFVSTSTLAIAGALRHAKPLCASFCCKQTRNITETDTPAKLGIVTDDQLSLTDRQLPLTDRLLDVVVID